MKVHLPIGSDGLIEIVCNDYVLEMNVNDKTGVVLCRDHVADLIDALKIALRTMHRAAKDSDLQCK